MIGCLAIFLLVLKLGGTSEKNHPVLHLGHEVALNRKLNRAGSSYEQKEGKSQEGSSSSEENEKQKKGKKDRKGKKQQSDSDEDPEVFFLQNNQHTTNHWGIPSFNFAKKIEKGSCSHWNI